MRNVPITTEGSWISSLLPITNARPRALHRYFSISGSYVWKVPIHHIRNNFYHHFHLNLHSSGCFPQLALCFCNNQSCAQTFCIWSRNNIHQDDVWGTCCIVGIYQYCLTDDRWTGVGLAIVVAAYTVPFPCFFLIICLPKIPTFGLALVGFRLGSFNLSTHCSPTELILDQTVCQVSIAFIICWLWPHHYSLTYGTKPQT